MFSKGVAIGAVLLGGSGGGQARGRHHLKTDFPPPFGNFPPLDLLVQVVRRVSTGGV